jgi:DNA-binding transcriptional regulator YiaG
MKTALNKPKKPRKRNQATTDLLESLTEMDGYVRRGMTIADMNREIQQRHPQRVRVAFRAPDPGKYPPGAVRNLRGAMSMSQATFAQVIGVSRVLVQSWERGVREPSSLACRLLDTISADPSAWLARLQSSNARPKRRAG